VIRRGEALLVVLLVQGGVGYLQYFSGVPAWLVQIHVTLAAVLWVVTLRFVLGLTGRPGNRVPASGALAAGEAEGSDAAGTNPILVAT
jgi:heme a synthase